LEAQNRELWRVLEIVQLADAIRQKKDQLDHEVKEYGSNFSQGEKQVLCLARALLRKPRILVLDEATSSVDWNTDKLIQKTVRAQFAETTCLTIAHRLNTIIDTDKVMVLQSGELAEFDSPANLLRNPDSYFTSMVAEYGEEVQAKLTALANEAQQSRQTRPQLCEATPVPEEVDKLIQKTGVDVDEIATVVAP